MFLVGPTDEFFCAAGELDTELFPRFEIGDWLGVLESALALPADLVTYLAPYLVATRLIVTRPTVPTIAVLSETHAVLI